MNLNYYESFILIILNGISVSENEFHSNPALPHPIIIWIIPLLSIMMIFIILKT